METVFLPSRIISQVCSFLPDIMSFTILYELITRYTFTYDDKKYALGSQTKANIFMLLNNGYCVRVCVFVQQWWEGIRGQYIACRRR